MKRGKNTTFPKINIEQDFESKLTKAKKSVIPLKNDEIDKHISPDWLKRRNSYNNSNWFLAEMNPIELGVWSKAGELPLRWTNGSLSETAERVKKAFARKSKFLSKRPKHAIPGILKISKHLEQGEKYLYPIVFKTDTGTQGRKRLKRKMKGDIDDGCMRSIALAISGKKNLLVYFGIPK